MDSTLQSTTLPNPTDVGSESGDQEMASIDVQQMSFFQQQHTYEQVTITFVSYTIVINWH